MTQENPDLAAKDATEEAQAAWFKEWWESLPDHSDYTGLSDEEIAKREQEFAEMNQAVFEQENDLPPTTRYLVRR